MSVEVNENTDEIIFTRGDDQTITFTVTQSTGAVQDITGWTFAFTVKASIDDNIVDAEFQKTTGGGGIALTTPASGILDVTIDAGDTQALAGSYVYDLQGTDGSGNIRTVAQSRFIVRKNVTTPGAAGSPSAPNPAFPGGVSFVGPVVTGVAPTYNEIIVDPNGAIGGYTTIQAAINYALPLSSASDPWTIRLLPGIYEQTAVLNAAGAQYLTFIGAGADATIINRAAALDNSDSTYGSITRDPVLKLTGSVGCQVMNLTIRHQGTPTTAPTARTPTALSINEATGFRAFNAKLLSTYTGVSANSAAVPTYSEGIENIFHNCDLKVVGPASSSLSAADTLWVINQYATLLNCFTTMESDWAGPDDLRFDGGHLKVIGGYHSRIYTGSQTIPNNSGSGCALNITPSTTASFVRFTAEGARFNLEFTGSPTGFGNATSVAALATFQTGADYELTLTGCAVTYSTPAIGTARAVAGLMINFPNTNGTLGTTRLVGTTFRDLGGSGGSARADVVIGATASGGNKIAKALYQSGSRIASIAYSIPNLGGAPTITGTYGTTENNINRQTGTATFATAATVAVTMPVSMGALGANQVTDYSVDIEQPNGTEVYWVTAKTSTGFTLNSSNAASTATVRYTVTR